MRKQLVFKNAWYLFKRADNQQEFKVILKDQWRLSRRHGYTLLKPEVKIIGKISLPRPRIFETIKDGVEHYFMSDGNPKDAHCISDSIMTYKEAKEKARHWNAMVQEEIKLQRLINKYK